MIRDAGGSVCLGHNRRTQSVYILAESARVIVGLSTFLADESDQETNDMGTVGAKFYLLIDHKNATNYGIDTLYRRTTTVSRK